MQVVCRGVPKSILVGTGVCEVEHTSSHIIQAWKSTKQSMTSSRSLKLRQVMENGEQEATT
eukprot:3174075-Amphidinium_carterae.2